MMINIILLLSPHQSAEGLILKCQADCWRTSQTVLNNKMFLPIHHQHLPPHLHSPVTKLFLQHPQKQFDMLHMRDKEQINLFHGIRKGKRPGLASLPGNPSLYPRDSNFKCPDCFISSFEFISRSVGEISSSDLFSLPLLFFYRSFCEWQ